MEEVFRYEKNLCYHINLLSLENALRFSKIKRISRTPPIRLVNSIL